MELRNYLAVLLKRWTLIVGILVASVLVAAGVTFLIPATYEADTQLFVSTQTDPGNANQQLFQGGSFSQDRVKSYAELASSPRVLDPVREQLGLTTPTGELAGEVQANVPTGTVLLELRVTNGNAQTAADLTNAIGAQLGSVIEELETPASGPPSPVKVSVLKQAIPADSPIWPSLPIDIGVGVLIGLILGIGIALVLETLDVTVKGADDLARVTALPVLATVVYDPTSTDQPIVRGDLNDSRSEAYRQLRTNLQFASVDEKPGVLVVTSALPGEGKSSVAGNLAMSLQQLGWTVCLVDGDLRRPSVATYFGLVGEAGLTTALIGRVAIDNVLQSAAPGLDILTSGAVPPNPAELLASERMTTLLRELSMRYDMVIVDAPPTLPVADAAALASRADGTLFVVQVGSTTRAQVELALSNLDQVKANVIGVVMNKAPARSGRAGYYDYSSTYRPQEPVVVPEVVTDPPPSATDDTVWLHTVAPTVGRELNAAMTGRDPSPAAAAQPNHAAWQPNPADSAPQASPVDSAPQASSAGSPPQPTPAETEQAHQAPSAPGTATSNGESVPTGQASHAGLGVSDRQGGSRRPSPRPHPDSSNSEPQE